MKTKILHITGTPSGIGGAERLLLDMADKFDPQRFAISYCNLFGAPDSEYPNALREKGFEVICISGQSSIHAPRIFADLVKMLRRKKFDVVHTHLIQATIAGQFAARFAKNSKQILTRHYTDDALTNSAYVLLLERRAMKMADKLTAVSKAVRADMLKAGIEDAKIELIYNGVDLEKFDGKLRERGDEVLPFESGDYIIGNIGNFWTRKGQADLIRALPKILAQCPKVKLVFIGEETKETDLKKLAAELKISEKIFFAGFRENVVALLKKFDLYVHPSRQEPFGIAVLEAMATGKCVVATDVGGVPEIVVEGKTGYLVPSKNPARLVETIVSAINRKTLTSEMGNAGRKRVEDVFSIEGSVKQYEKLYSELSRF